MVRVIAYVWNTVLLLLARLLRFSPLRTVLILVYYGMCDDQLVICRKKGG